MKTKKDKLLREKILNFVKYDMSQRDRKLFVESIILIIIYLLSFVMLSMGRVPQSFLGISADTFSNIQIVVLTFVFAVVITLILYSIYKQTTK